MAAHHKFDGSRVGVGETRCEQYPTHYAASVILRELARWASYRLSIGFGFGGSAAGSGRRGAGFTPGLLGPSVGVHVFFS